MAHNSASTTDTKPNSHATKKADPTTKGTTANVPMRPGTADASASRGRHDAPQNHTSDPVKRSPSKGQAQKGIRTASPVRPPSQQRQDSGRNRTASPDRCLTLATFGTVSPPQVLKDEKRPKTNKTSSSILDKAWKEYAAGELEGYD